MERAGERGDIGDEADRLAMAAEAADSSELEGAGYPLADLEEFLAEEDAADGSDDPLHAGGLRPARWVPAETAAMHIVTPDDPTSATWLDEETNAERADPMRDQFDGPEGELTPEDETLRGINPYD